MYAQTGPKDFLNETHFFLVSFYVKNNNKIKKIILKDLEVALNDLVLLHSSFLTFFHLKITPLETNFNFVSTF